LTLDVHKNFVKGYEMQLKRIGSHPLEVYSVAGEYLKYECM